MRLYSLEAVGMSLMVSVDSAGETGTYPHLEKCRERFTKERPGLAPTDGM